MCSPAHLLDGPSFSLWAPQQGPTLSDLLGVGQAAASGVSAILGTLFSPFALFGPEQWLLNFLFYSTIALLSYSLVIAAPRQ